MGGFFTTKLTKRTKGILKSFFVDFVVFVVKSPGRGRQRWCEAPRKVLLYLT